MTSPTEANQIATSILRSLTGNRWMWPPMRVVDRYPVHTRRLRLTGRPIIEINSVTDVATGNAIEFQPTAMAWVLLTGPTFPTCYNNGVKEVDVDYIYGSRPPQTFVRAVDILAKEMLLADENSLECRLPERVQNVNREGVSWTLIDPQDFLTEGRTGIYDIDLVITAAGGAKARSAVFSTEYPPALRLSVEQQPDPDEVP